MAIKNTSDLRKMLLETIDGVRKETIDAKQAGAIAALSGKVLQSARLDLEMLKFNLDHDGALQAGKAVLQLIN